MTDDVVLVCGWYFTVLALYLFDKNLNKEMGLQCEIQVLVGGSCFCHFLSCVKGKIKS